MRFYEEQTKRFSNQIRQYDDGQNLLGEDNYNMGGNQQQVYDPYGYKDYSTKTFYTGYGQQRYGFGDGSFPGRRSYAVNTVNIKKSKLNPYINDYNYGSNYTFKKVLNKSLCPDCGKLEASYGGNQYTVKVNHLCPGCGKIKQA